MKNVRFSVEWLSHLITIVNLFVHINIQRYIKVEIQAAHGLVSSLTASASCALMVLVCVSIGSGIFWARNCVQKEDFSFTTNTNQQMMNKQQIEIHTTTN